MRFPVNRRNPEKVNPEKKKFTIAQIYDLRLKIQFDECYFQIYCNLDISDKVKNQFKIFTLAH